MVHVAAHGDDAAVLQRAAHDHGVGPHNVVVADVRRVDDCFRLEAVERIDLHHQRLRGVHDPHRILKDVVVTDFYGSSRSLDLDAALENVAFADLDVVDEQRVHDFG